MPYDVVGIEDAGNVPESQATFPQFIQFQKDGVNLGGPDIRTVNLADGIEATRGVGENAAKLTLEAGSASGSDSMVIELTASLDQSIGAQSAWSFTTFRSAAPSSWEDDVLTFAQAGVYRVIVSSRFAPVAGDFSDGWGTGSVEDPRSTLFGVRAGNTELGALAEGSQHFLANIFGDVSPLEKYEPATITDVFYLVAAANDSTSLEAFMRVDEKAYPSTTNVRLQVEVQRLGAAP